MSDEPRKARRDERYGRRKASLEAAYRRTLDLLQDRPEEPDVPLHQRGFGVMDDDEPPA